MGLRELMECARAHQTKMADAMLVACVVRATETGERLGVTDSDVERFVRAVEGQQT